MDERTRRLRERVAQWEETTLKTARERIPESQEKFRTTSGLQVKPVYTPLDAAPDNYLENLGMPGEYPFTRGVHATGYRAKLWTRRPITGFQTPAATNERFRKLLQQGQTGLHFVFDYPTLSGVGSLDPRAEGEVGRDGLPVNTLRDVEELLDGVDLEQVSISFSYWGPIIFSMLIALAERRGVPRSRLQGTIQNDVLMYYHSCPWFEMPLRANMKMFVDVVEFAVAQMPLWNVVGISGYNIREGGGSAAQEIAFTLGDAKAYIDACLERGLDIDDFAPRMSFHLDLHNDFFEEICKMRALRRMWAKLLRDHYHAQKQRSMMFRFHSQTAGSTYTATQPLNNVIRGTIQALAGVLGGTQSLHVSAYDEALGLPSEDAHALSINTQNIIAYESGVHRTVDPLGGSYFVEALTNELEEKAWAILGEIDAQGGMVEAALNGWIQDQKMQQMAEYLRQVESGAQRVVGVNVNVPAEEKPIELLAFESNFEQDYITSVRAVVAERDEVATQAALRALEEACRRGDNVIEATVAAVKTYATLAECYQAYHAVWGEMSHDEMMRSIGYR